MNHESQGDPDYPEDRYYPVYRYDYREGILRSLAGRAGRATLREIKADLQAEMAGALGDPTVTLSLQAVEDARSALVEEGRLTHYLGWPGASRYGKRSLILQLSRRLIPKKPEKDAEGTG